MYLDTQTLLFNKPLKGNAVYLLFTKCLHDVKLNCVIWVRFIFSMIVYILTSFAYLGAVSSVLMTFCTVQSFPNVNESTKRKY